MIARILVLAAILAGLLVWERSLESSAARTRRESARVRQLVPVVEREGKTIAALKVDDRARGSHHVYGRTAGAWRCLTYRGAIASEAGIQVLIGKLFEAEGIVLDVDPASFPEYGLDASSMVRLEIHGPQVMQSPAGDLLFAFDVGHALAAGEGLGSAALQGCYVRLSGKQELWSIDRNLLEDLRPADLGELPPLLDRALVPGMWPGSRTGLREVRVEPGNAPPFALQRRDRVVTPEEVRAGTDPWVWVLVQGGVEEETHPVLAMGYTLFLMRAPWKEVADPAGRDSLGVDPPRATVTLLAEDAPPFVLAIGREGLRGTGVECAFSQLLYLVTQEVARLLLPDPGDLQDPERGNPWDPYLRQG